MHDAAQPITTAAAAWQALKDRLLSAALRGKHSCCQLLQHEADDLDAVQCIVHDAAVPRIVSFHAQRAVLALIMTTVAGMHSTALGKAGRQTGKQQLNAVPMNDVLVGEDTWSMHVMLM
jgi:hypothetical protein